MRAALVTLVAMLGVPASIQAQWSVTAQFGVHADRLHSPQRVLADGGSTYMMSAPGEAPVVGLRLSRALTRHFDLDAGLAVSQNRSFSGGGPVPLPDFAKRTTFASVTVIWRPVSPAPRVQLGLGAGPAVIFHGGSGESVLARQVDIGATIMPSASVRLGERVRFGLDVQNYQFASRFADAQFQGHTMPPDYTAGTRWRSDWVVLPSLRVAF
jgi:hypothetical protein